VHSKRVFRCELVAPPPNKDEGGRQMRKLGTARNCSVTYWDGTLMIQGYDRTPRGLSFGSDRIEVWSASDGAMTAGQKILTTLAAAMHGVDFPEMNEGSIPSSVRIAGFASMRGFVDGVSNCHVTDNGDEIYVSRMVPMPNGEGFSFVKDGRIDTDKSPVSIGWAVYRALGINTTHRDSTE